MGSGSGQPSSENDLSVDEATLLTLANGTNHLETIDFYRPAATVENMISTNKIYRMIPSSDVYGDECSVKKCYQVWPLTHFFPFSILSQDTIKYK